MGAKVFTTFTPDSVQLLWTPFYAPVSLPLSPLSRPLSLSLSPADFSSATVAGKLGRTNRFFKKRR
jgi:hypothetical protein